MLIENGFSQVKILNQSLIYPDSAVLYVGVGNKIIIIGPDTTKQFEVISSSGTLQSNKRNEYDARVSKPNSLDTIFVLYKKKIIASKIFRVDLIGEPIAMLDSIKTRIVTKAELKKCKELKVNIPNCISIINERITVFKYQIYFDCKTCDEIPVLENSNGILNKNFYKYIDYLKSGDKIYFENIKYSPSGCFKKIDISYTIK